MQQPTAPRVIRLHEDVYAQVIERGATSPLPKQLGPLLSGLSAVRWRSVAVVGTRAACTDAQHDFQPWMQGVYAGLELRLALCQYCGVVEVRDVSLDLLPDLMAGRSGPHRRDEVLGWYSGQRPSGRTYL